MSSFRFAYGGVETILSNVSTLLSAGVTPHGPWIVPDFLRFGRRSWSSDTRSRRRDAAARPRERAGALISQPRVFFEREFRRDLESLGLISRSTEILVSTSVRARGSAPDVGDPLPVFSRPAEGSACSAGTLLRLMVRRCWTLGLAGHPRTVSSSRRTRTSTWSRAARLKRRAAPLKTACETRRLQALDPTDRSGRRALCVSDPQSAAAAAAFPAARVSARVVPGRAPACRLAIVRSRSIVTSPFPWPSPALRPLASVARAPPLPGGRSRSSPRAIASDHDRDGRLRLTDVKAIP